MVNGVIKWIIIHNNILLGNMKDIQRGVSGWNRGYASWTAAMVKIDRCKMWFYGIKK